MLPTQSTLYGVSTITCSLDGDVFFYDSFGRKARTGPFVNIGANNGIIHIIDTVLLPGGKVDDITGNIANLSALDSALEANGLDSVLADDSTEYTLFAPSNEAIAAFSGDITNNQLLYHVVVGTYLTFDVPDTETSLPTANGGYANITVINTNGVVTVTDVLGRVATVTTANIAGTNGVVHIIDV